MGLGKTVEILGLILMNPRKTGVKRSVEVLEDNLDLDNNERKGVDRWIRCICHSNFTSKGKKIEGLIVCRNCKTYQHERCVFQEDTCKGDESQYLCPLCWKTENKFIESKTTFIVTPASIKNQWKDEILKHIGDKSFKTKFYDGISKGGWIGPNELSQYDVIITDFNTLSRELYFSDTNSSDRNMRKEKKFEYPPSPLTFVKWWRVVLDEAQLVENKNNRPSLMVKQLQAVHRWASTGTPIEKDSISCLYGLLFFINYDPFVNETLFNRLCNEYRAGRHDEMVSTLVKVMWRTCKKDVEDQINIPKQTEVLHQVEMSDLQKCYYRQAHIDGKRNFMSNVRDFLLRQAGIGRNDRKLGYSENRIDYSLKDKYLYQLNNATLKMFLEPLRKLRQDCTIPSILHKTNDQTRVKKVLKPEELHEHLVSKTSIESKSQLRSICSSINGTAAMKFAEKEYDAAVSCYKQILKLAEQYKGVVCVDSMVQIHAYNNLIEISNCADRVESEVAVDEYTENMRKLEWKYVSNFYDKVKAVLRDIDQYENEYMEAMSNFKDRKGYWWLEVIEIAFNSNEEAQKIMEVINTEVFSQISDRNQIIEQLRTFRGIQMVLTEWTDKIRSYTKSVTKKFNDLSFIIMDLKSSRTPEVNEKIEQIAREALDCHLNLLEDEDSDSEMMTMSKPRSSLCKLCKLKMQLNEYECVLFNKSLIDGVTEGTWNARTEEKLLVALLKHARRHSSGEGIVLVGTRFFKYLEALKQKFKYLAKLWVEVNYTVSAFDEINMCKMRIQVCDSPDEITDEDARFKLKILRFEIPEQLEMFAAQKAEAEIGFVRLNGRLKYLEHLKDQSQPMICPICTNPPLARYFVTICGHCICDECYIIMVRNRRKFINCPVCRTHQETREVLAVNNESSTSEPINGSYSPKIDQMVRCILSLMKEEPDVKIILFSHWDPILYAILPALDANNINYRSSFAPNFNKQVEDFKDYTKDVTCLLLNLKFGGKGLNLIEATHVFLVEPILNADDEFQAIGRVHRIGQTRETFVHRFITKSTIEETIYGKITREIEKWTMKHFSIRDLEELFDVDGEEENDFNVMDED